MLDEKEIGMAEFESPIPLSNRKKWVLEAHRRGYRIKDGVILNPWGDALEGWVKPYPNSNGYRYIALGGCSKAAVHQMVAFQKFGFRWLYADVHVRHLDGNSLNNRDENIEIGTASDNQMDQKPEARRRRAIHASSFQQRFPNVLQIRAFYQGCRSYKKTMARFGITSKGTLFFILNKAHPAPEIVPLIQTALIQSALWIGLADSKSASREGVGVRVTLPAI